MKTRLLFLFKYYFFWLILFWLFKALFLAYHYSIYSSFSFIDLLKVFAYGTKLDLSFSAYIIILPIFILAFSSFFKFDVFQKIIRYYTYVIIPLMGLITFTDLEIFRWWGFRIDSTLFKYINTPKEVLASIWMSPIIILPIFLIITCIILCIGYKKFIEVNPKEVKKGGILSFIVILLFTPITFVIIRGGFQLAAINQSSVYFSTDQFLNQAAINAPWNLAYSILEQNYNETNPFLYQPEKVAKERVAALYADSSRNYVQVVNGEKLNVILIIWESFTAKSVESLGGKKGITPGIEKLIHEGIFFDSIFASGDRSDKGLIAVLSSFPAQPITSIMNKTTKAAKLPSISKTFKEHKYNTSFYYGGEPEFANIKSYLLNSKFDKLITKEDFPAESWNSKWGAHDDIVLSQMLHDLKKEPQPFFSSIFTLSSHEPFEIPSAPLLPGKDEESLFLNSIHYTDSSIADFVEKAKKESWWKNTLIIITADHGHPLPRMEAINGVTHFPSEFHVPMLWLGGALTKKDTVISTIGSQTDLSNSLFSQLKIPTKEFSFSKNLLSAQPNSFSYYAFKNGFGYITPRGHFVFDNVSQNFLQKTPGISEEDILNGKAYLQYSFQEYINY